MSYIFFTELTHLSFSQSSRTFRHASKTSKPSNVLRFGRISSQNHFNEVRNLKSIDIWCGIYRREMAQSCLGMAGLEIPVTCVYVLGCRGICYTALPDTGVFCDCRVGQAPHWIIPYSLEHTILPFCSTPFKSGLFFYSFWPYRRKLHAEH